MTPERWHQITDLFDAATRREPSDREAFVAAACGDDDLLLAEVRSLLDAHRDGADPAVEAAVAGPPFRPGHAIGPYRIEYLLGRGGMGEVYRARDTDLDRDVALKVLPESFAADPDRLARFKRESHVLASLSHPHIAGIHGLEKSGPIQALVLELVDGPTLAEQIAQGPMAPGDVVTIARQILEALDAAHAAGVVHRDIKPANVMVAARGGVKIVDFGLARLPGAVVTQTGLMAGTLAYMAPEQFRGVSDARADLWALGAVMYEMLTGRQPFARDDAVATMEAVLNREPAPVRSLRPEVPPALAAVVERALQKAPANRFTTAREMLKALDVIGLVGAAGEGIRPVRHTIRRRVAALLVIAIVAGLGYVLAVTLVDRSRARWAREVALPEIRRLIEQDDYDAAYPLAQQAFRYIPSDPVLAELWPQVADEPQVRTAPPGARVYVKPYSSPDAEWRLLGPTPLAGVTLARGAYRWRIEADGFEPVELARNTAPEPPDQVVIDVDLAQVGTVPSGMVSVPPIQGFVQLTGFTAEDFVSLEPYFIDRYEVTNQGFKEFVDAGAYTRREYWKHDVVQDGRPLTWTQAMELFRDSSGRPGPATWELGTYAAGQADYPVAGVSWYEAAAYAEFRGASLPTVYHWAHAALTFTRFAPIRGLIVEAGNLSGKGAVAVGSTGSLGPLGTYDMAGNVREWCWNLSGKNRWIVGGDWTDSAYMSIVPYNLPPLDRSATNGFRLVRYSGKEGLAALAMPREVVGRDYRTEKPVSNEVFEVFKRQFAYSPSPAEARVEATDTSAEDWIREKVSIETGYGERMTAYIFTPKTGAGRRQVAVHFMGLPVGVNSSQDLMPGFFDFVVKSGRVLVLPVWKGFYERNDGFMTLTGDRHLQAMRQRMREWRQELGQLLDYLTARPDVHPAALAFLGTSFGGSTALPVVAMEPRFKAAVLHIAGLPYREMLPEVDAVNFAPRITIPVLMLGGRYDSVFPVELSQEPLLTLLGAPAHQKHQVLFDAGHGRLPRGRMIHETLTWLDRYLGEPDNP